jgi:uncharacterized membrane protein
MKSLLSPGRIIYGIAIACLGAHFLLWISKIVPPPGPPWFPGSVWVSWATGVGLLAAGVCLVLNFKAKLAAMLLGIGLLIRALVYVPRVLANPHDPGPWTSGGEILALAAAALVLAGALSRHPGSVMQGRSLSTILAGQYLFTVLLFIVGIQHFMYARFVSTLIPAWIPARLFFAYFVGAAFFACALAIIFRQATSLATTLLGLMFFSWVLILHSPGVWASPHNGNEWTSEFICLAMCGAAFVIAGTSAQAE